MAGGSIGAFVGSEISKRFSTSFNDYGLEFFSISAIILLFIGLCAGLFLINSTNSNQNKESFKPLGGASFDGIKNALTKKDIRSIAIYVWLFTGLMTIHWMTAISIIESWSSDSVERIALFSRMEQMVTVLSLPTQLLLTSLIINFLGVKRILFLYGIAFLFIYIIYAVSPTISIVIFATVFLRLFEYAINKPTREIVFSYLDQNDRYKSSVFIDTFFSRFLFFILVSYVIVLGLRELQFQPRPFMAYLNRLYSSDDNFQTVIGKNEPIGGAIQLQVWLFAKPAMMACTRKSLSNDTQ